MHTRAWALATLNLLLIPSLPFAYTPSFCVALAGAAEGAGASNARPRSLDAFFVMRTLEPMRKRLEAAKKDEFAAAQATRIAQQELLEQERELGLKRRRVASSPMRKTGSGIGGATPTGCGKRRGRRSGAR